MRLAARSLLAALAAAVLTPGAASAAVNLTRYDFHIETSGPYATHDGAFVVAVDSGTGAGSLQSIDFKIGASVFTLADVGLFYYGPGAFMIGGLLNGITDIGGGPDFRLSVGPFFGDFAYAPAGDGLYLGASAIQVTRTDLPSPAAVPEPGAWALMILGFGSAGAMLRRRSTLAA